MQAHVQQLEKQLAGVGAGAGEGVPCMTKVSGEEEGAGAGAGGVRGFIGEGGGLVGGGPPSSNVDQQSLATGQAKHSTCHHSGHQHHLLERGRHSAHRGPDLQPSVSDGCCDLDPPVQPYTPEVRGCNVFLKCLWTLLIWTLLYSFLHKRSRIQIHLCEHLGHMLFSFPHK